MVQVFREHGPAKSGKTTRLVRRANTAVVVGARATLHVIEHAPGTLRARYGLNAEVRVVVHPLDPGMPADAQEWLAIESKEPAGRLRPWRARP